MKKIIFAFIVLLALFAAFIVLANRINKVLLGDQPPRTSQARTNGGVICAAMRDFTTPPEHAG
jgi:hypothetical protein